MSNAKPFLKWAGGKKQLITEIENVFPYDKNDSFSYVEPFVGGGAVLFWVLNNFTNLEYVVINDANRDLITAYDMVKNRVDDLIPILEKIETGYHSLSENPEERKKYYYNMRRIFNQRGYDLLIQTALFIFLNKTCFNGLYRVNKKGEFNVPMGSYKRPVICDNTTLLRASEALKDVELKCGDFEHTLEEIGRNTLYYIDPPYKPISKSSNFNSYTAESFNDDEQKRLKMFCDELDLVGAKFILSNSDNPLFYDLYSEYNMKTIFANRNINSKGNKRGKISELIITN